MAFSALCRGCLLYTSILSCTFAGAWKAADGLLEVVRSELAGERRWRQRQRRADEGRSGELRIRPIRPNGFGADVDGEVGRHAHLRVARPDDVEAVRVAAEHRVEMHLVEQLRPFRKEFHFDVELWISDFHLFCRE